MNSPKFNLEIGRLGVVHFLRASGVDADAFLQGQVSSDLRQLSETHAQVSSYNSPKGRMLALPHLIRTAGGILIELHPSVAAATLKRLRMFVLRSKVLIEDVSATTAALGLIGEGAAGWLREQRLPAPDAPLETAGADGLVVVRRLGSLPRYSVIGDPARLAELPGAGSGIDSAWRHADIDAGVAVVTDATSDHFVPQMANLDLVGGISFDKGCYTGQEIVARLHYLGQLKRRMAVYRIAGSPPVPGTDVLDGDGTVGEVVDAVADGDAAIASVVVQRAHIDSTQLRTANGAAVSLQRRFD